MTNRDPDRIEEVPPFDVERLGWDVDSPSPEFADRVVEVLEGKGSATSTPERTAPRRQVSPRWVWVAGAGVAAAGLALWLVRAPSPETIRGQLSAAAVATEDIGQRAVVVAQPGAELYWSGEEGGAFRVTQKFGRAFYRVDTGQPFRVDTPTGSVRVTGTCFQVEVETMKTKDMKVATAGAALATMVTVVVYEGSVVFANGGHDVALGPSQRASAVGMEAPSLKGEQVALAPEATAVMRRQEREIARLRAQLETAEPGKGEAPADEPAPPEDPRVCALANRDDDSTCSFLEPSPETLQRMANCGAVRTDIPGFLDNLVVPNDVGRLAADLRVEDEGEREHLLAAAQAHYEEFQRELRALYLELGGDPEIADDAPPEAIEAMVRDLADEDALGRVVVQLAQERAGLAEPPGAGELPVEQRTVRLLAGVGDRFEHHLSRELGPERARELRRVNDGWPRSSRVVSMGSCETE